MYKEKAMKPFYCLILVVLSLLGGCSQTVESTEALDASRLPWGRPADWEKSMPIAPGVRY